MALDWTGMEAVDNRRARVGGYENGGQWDSGLGSSGNSMLDWIRNQGLSDASARTRALRGAATSRAGYDPSLAAWGSLEGLIQGQSDAARNVNAGAFDWAKIQDQRAWEEYLMRLKRKWAEEDARRAAGEALWSNIGDKVGNIGESAVRKYFGL